MASFENLSGSALSRVHVGITIGRLYTVVEKFNNYTCTCMYIP